MTAVATKSRASSSARANTNSASDADHLSLAERAYVEIRDRILAMELRPGQFLNEAALCNLIGIGRMPVHQATHRLRAEGLIDVFPRKGLVVRMDSLHDIVALLEARLAVEPTVAALAAERIKGLKVTQIEHEGVLSAILRHDSDGARQAMSAHLESLHHRIVTAVKVGPSA